MVTLVKALGERDPYRLQQLLDVNETQVKWITAALKIGDEARLIAAIKTGEQTLEGMGVVSDSVMTFIRAIERVGGAAKILGGGGKKESVGFLLCYHHDQDVIKKLLPPTYTIQQVLLGEEGIRLEQKK
jgi:mevalonate kinase